MLEVLDFLGELRGAIGEGRALGVLLLEGSAADREAWTRRLSTLGDPGLVALTTRRDPGLVALARRGDPGLAAWAQPGGSGSVARAQPGDPGSVASSPTDDREGRG
jgi:hypothetical protein